MLPADDLAGFHGVALGEVSELAVAGLEPLVGPDGEEGEASVPGVAGDVVALGFFGAARDGGEEVGVGGAQVERPESELERFITGGVVGAVDGDVVEGLGEGEGGGEDGGLGEVGRRAEERAPGVDDALGGGEDDVGLGGGVAHAAVASDGAAENEPAEGLGVDLGAGVSRGEGFEAFDGGVGLVLVGVDEGDLGAAVGELEGGVVGAGGGELFGPVEDGAGALGVGGRHGEEGVEEAAGAGEGAGGGFVVGRSGEVAGQEGLGDVEVAEGGGGAGVGVGGAEDLVERARGLVLGRGVGGGGRGDAAEELGAASRVEAFTHRHLIKDGAREFVLGEFAEKRGVALWRTQKKFFDKANEYKGMHLVGLWMLSGANLYHGSKPLRSLADLKNEKMWCIAGMPNKMMTEFGAVVVSVPGVKMFNVVSKGIVNGKTTSHYTMRAFKTMPYIKFATEVPDGLHAVTFSLIMNEKKWKRLPKKDREAIDSVSGERVAFNAGRKTDQLDAAVKKEAMSKGVKFETASPAFVAEMKKMSAHFTTDWIATAKERGVDGAAALAYFKSQVK